jgi:amino acid transporter
MGITVLVYVLVVATAVMLVDPAALNEGEAPLLQVVAAGAPGFPVGIFAVISMFAVANTALIVLLMASRLLYGMAQESVLPAALATVGHRRQTPWVAILAATGLAVVLISVSDLRALADTSSLLTVSVFTVCNVSVLVLRRDKVEHTHFKTPTLAAVLGAGTCAFLASPLSGREPQQYAVAAALLAFGIVLWLLNRGVMAALPAARRRRRPSTTGSPIVESDEQPTGG